MKIKESIKKMFLMILPSIVFILLVAFMSKNINKKESYINTDNPYEDQTGLYKKEVGTVGTRKQFSSMRKPFLNPVLVPLSN